MSGQFGNLRRGQRLLLFFFLYGGGLLLLLAIGYFAWDLLSGATPRSMAEPVVDGVSVSEFAVLPGDNAYPATVAVGPDGRVYSGSYETGVVYEIDPDGTVRELPDTRVKIGSVTGISVNENGTLYVLDRLVSNPRSAGGALWRVVPNEAAQEYGTINDEQGFVSPDDVVVVPGEGVYVTDRGRRQVWRFRDGGENTMFWEPPDALENFLPTGLTYDAGRDSLLITDSSENRIHRVPLGGGPGELFYTYEGGDNRITFDGISAAGDGAVYLAALEGGVGLLEDGAYTPLATNFRGASDVAYAGGQLFVTNFDSASLVNPLIDPQLPFALDVLTFEG